MPHTLMVNHVLTVYRLVVYASGFGWLPHSDWFTMDEAQRAADRLQKRPLLARIYIIEAHTKEYELSHMEIVKCCSPASCSLSGCCTYCGTDSAS